LSTPGDLKFVRLSWKLDRLPGFLGVFRLVGYAALGTARKVASMASKRRTSSDEGGLTLLVMARKGVRF